MTFTEKYSDSEIRALSWKDPFGSLMLNGKIETRVWDTKYRGLVLICTSQKAYDNFELLRIAGNEQFGIINSLGMHEKHGEAIAIGRLVDSRPMVKEDEAKCFVAYREPWIEERVSKKTGQTKFVECKLWCHVYEDVHPIFPFDWKGSQGWGKVADEIKNQIRFVL